MLILVADCQGRTIQFPLVDSSGQITVGSLPENQIYLPYKGVSRHHFTLVRSDDSWILKDLGSTNGTRVNGAKVKEAIIRPKDKIQLGTVQMVLNDTSDEEIIKVPPDSRDTGDRLETDKVGAAFTRRESGFQSSKLILPEGMVMGTSGAMNQIYRKLDSLVDSDVSVLLTGETGTGKEMLARILHLSGKRAKSRFVAVNCAAIPSELVEAELFGIGERVATDVSRRDGKMAMAHQGTLFLDELEAFPIGMQAKILRAIEEKHVTPVGHHEPVSADFRLIAATNEDPADLISGKKLREDLYHRIAGVEISIPPLRERKEDLPTLIVSLLRQIVKKEKKPIVGVSKQLFSSLCEYSYPGNVRELLNLLNSMVALAHPGEVLDTDLAPGKLLRHNSGQHVIEEDAAGDIDLHEKLDEVSRKLILKALEQHNSNVAAAARSLHISQFGLRKMMKRLNIEAK